MSNVEQHELPPIVTATLHALVDVFLIERNRAVDALRREAEARRQLNVAKRRIRDLENEKRRKQ
jgi:hypothetical protein